jgi:hypothetical protein
MRLILCSQGRIYVGSRVRILAFLELYTGVNVVFHDYLFIRVP